MKEDLALPAVSEETNPDDTSNQGGESETDRTEGNSE